MLFIIVHLLRNSPFLLLLSMLEGHVFTVARLTYLGTSALTVSFLDQDRCRECEIIVSSEYPSVFFGSCDLSGHGLSGGAIAGIVVAIVVVVVACVVVVFLVLRRRKRRESKKPIYTEDLLSPT